MKVALITDTHWGVRNDAPEFLAMSKKFVDEVFLPTIKKRQIEEVVHLGDLLDRRKYINFQTANHLTTNFLMPVCTVIKKWHQIYGNHDVYHKNTNSLAGVRELYRDFEPEKFKHYDRATEIRLLDGTHVLLVPWLTDDNGDHGLELIQETKAQVCFGHLELEGFEMYRGQACEEGLPASLFHKFDVTCSGHFHHKSSKNGIHYLGSHGEFTWGDYNDERGFHIFDTKTRELEFIQNPYTMFEKIHYEDDESGFSCTLPDPEGKHVKVIVSSRGDQILFEQFIQGLEDGNAVDIQVVDDHLNAGDVVDAMEEIDETEDTLSIFTKATELYDGDREQLDGFIRELYNEALQTE